MMDSFRLFQLIILALVIYYIFFYFSCTKKKQLFKESCSRCHENFCPPEFNDLSPKVTEETLNNHYQTLNKENPCYKKSHRHGYDSPYIYPYHHQLNPLNVEAEQYPQWLRYMASEQEEKTFPGYIQ